jgi:hypothetical protein
MKLSKKQITQLTASLYDIQRAYDYLQQPEIIGIARRISEQRANGADYKIINPECVETCSNASLYVGLSNKDIGSDIAGLSMGLNKLRSFIENNLE